MTIPQATSRVQRMPGFERTVRAIPAQPSFTFSEAVGGQVPDGAIPEIGRSIVGASAVGAFASPPLRVGELWLFQETVHQLSSAPWSRSPLEMARAAVEHGLSRMAELPQGLLTQHALMVTWGEFADEIVLIEKLNQVAIPQKSVVHTPQAKVLSFLMGILSGTPHLKDLNEGPHPLAHDGPALRAWQLAACDEETVAAISQVLHEISRPFIEQEVRWLRQRGDPLIIDLDLAPRWVTNTSTTFPGAEFGWQGDQVGLGYDAALAALSSPRYGRLFLSGFHHPRHTMALPRLQKMVRAAEKALGYRPRRRTECDKQRLQALDQVIARRQGWLLAQVEKQRVLLTRLDTLPQELAHWEGEVSRLEALYQAQGRPERNTDLNSLLYYFARVSFRP